MHTCPRVNFWLAWTSLLTGSEADREQPTELCSDDGGREREMEVGREGESEEDEAEDEESRQVRVLILGSFQAVPFSFLVCNVL